MKGNLLSVKEDMREGALDGNVVDDLNGQQNKVVVKVKNNPEKRIYFGINLGEKIPFGIAGEEIIQIEYSKYDEQRKNYGPWRKFEMTYQEYLDNIVYIGMNVMKEIDLIHSHTRVNNYKSMLSNENEAYRLLNNPEIFNSNGMDTNVFLDSEADSECDWSDDQEETAIKAWEHTILRMRKKLGKSVTQS